MPVYEYKCPKCKHIQEQFSKICAIDIFSPQCEKCGMLMDKIISKSQGKPVIKEYYSENLDMIITGPKHLEQVMKQRGVSQVSHNDIKER